MPTKKSAQTMRSSAKTYRNVPVMVPKFDFLSQDAFDTKPWKFHLPIYFLGEQPFTISCKEYSYFMTDDADELAKELKKYHVSPPSVKKYKPNHALAHSVRLKMLELGAKWSVILVEKNVILNYYTKEDGAFTAVIDR